MAISPDSRLLAASSDDGHVYLWDISDPAHPRALPPTAAGSEVVSVAFGAGSKYLAAATIDHKVHLWDLRTPGHARALSTLGGFKNYAWSVAFSPDSELLAAGGADNTIRLWDFSDPAHPRELGGSFVGPTHYVFSLAFSPDDKTLAASGGDGSVWTWSLADPSRPEVVSTLHAADPNGGTYAVAFTPNGQQLAAAGTAGQVTMWDTDVNAATEVECRLRGTPLTRAEWDTYVPGAPSEICARSRYSVAVRHEAAAAQVSPRGYGARRWRPIRRRSRAACGCCAAMRRRAGRMPLAR